MDIVSNNADRELFNIATSLSQDPQSWQSWFCLKIDLSTCNDALYEDSLNWVRSIIKTHLKDVQGHAYFCESKAVHILCKPPSEKVLEQTGAQICDLIASENGEKATHTLYNLFKQGAEYAQDTACLTENIFTLPLASAPDSASSDHSTEEEENKTPLKQPGLPGKKTLSTQETRKVLLVEDDPITRWMVRNALKDICDFATASTASKAYAIYTSYQPDVVFLDINLPDKNGRAVLDWIMEHDPGACVVMFSSNGSLDNIKECLNDGASGFITKPFLKEDLLHYVQHSAG